MKLMDRKVIDFIEQVSSKSPAPGGGSVSALSGALGVSLALMVGHLTIGKKKFLEKDIAIQNMFQKTVEDLKEIETALMPLVDQDTEAFDHIMQAYRLPKASEEELNVRKKAIVKATLEAIHVPQRVASLSLEALKKLSIMIEHGNTSAISDLGVSILHLVTAIEGASMNIKINTPSLEDDHQKQAFIAWANQATLEAHQIKQEELPKIYSKIG